MRAPQRAEIKLRPPRPLRAIRKPRKLRTRAKAVSLGPVAMRVALLWFNPETNQQHALDTSMVLECPNRAALEYARAHLVRAVKELDGVIVVDPSETESCEESEI